MLTNSWLRTGQLYLTYHHIFSPRPTYCARSTFVLPVLGFFALTFTAHSTAFVNPTLRGFAVFDTQLYLRISQKKRVFCRCFCLHCCFDNDFRLLLVLSLLVSLLDSNNRLQIFSSLRAATRVTTAVIPHKLPEAIAAHLLVSSEKNIDRLNPQQRFCKQPHYS